MTTKTIVCLANSFRQGGSCVAGIELVDGKLGSWVRPVSHRQNQAISIPEKTYDNGNQLSVLDLVEMKFDRHQPEHHQTENWLINEGVRWKKLGQLTPAQLAGAVLPTDTPLWHPAQSTITGLNDKVMADIAQQFDYSLAFVQPETAIVDVSYNAYGKKTEVWVSFVWAGTQHKIKLTDPVQFAHFKTGDGDSHSLTSPMLCISLAHVWEQQGTASKLVAGLIT